MSSIIEGYNYDIFISYRQKDNKGDGWVSEFVEALKTELESTFKEDISVYFDINPHDGLLETHDVDESLKEKLNCLIFIPIISRTYCDPKAFAWEHEFKAFLHQASEDQLGLKVKLPRGNVASRVLPVQIHELDDADKKLVEDELEGHLRGIDFIYKEAGIDKPLAPDDDEKKNLNNTKYRIQIIKVAHAIKEIIQGMKNESEGVTKGKNQARESISEIRQDKHKVEGKKPLKVVNLRFITSAIVVVLLIIAGIIAYPKIFKKDTLKRLRASGEGISIAVMPFQNLTNDTVWNVWQNGIQINLITSLSNTEELKVRQTETINELLKGRGVIDYASLTPSVASSVSKKLDTDIFIYGSINQAGSTIRVNMQLIDSKTREIFKSYQIDGSPERILNIIDSLSSMVNNFLIISRLEKEILLRGSFKVTTTTSPEAYRYFINGQTAFDQTDYPAAVKLLSQALEADSNFIDAAIILSYAYFNQNMFGKGKEICLKVYAKREQMPFYLKIRTNFLYSIYFETTYEQIEWLEQLRNYDDQIVSNYLNIAALYYDLGQYDKAISEVEKYMELYNKLDLKPTWPWEYVLPALIYHKNNEYDKEKNYYRMAERDFPDDPEVIFNRAILELTIGDTVSANKDIRKYISVRRDNLWTEADITSTLASIYSEAGMLDKAEEYYRKAAAMQQDNPGTWSRKQINNQFRLNNLAWFLIDKDRNINEGLELVNRELESSPDDYLYLDCKGWGLYKQGKYDEALKFLEKSWSLKPVYIHEIYLHLEAAKKAVIN